MEVIIRFYHEHPAACLIIVIVLVLISILIMMLPFIIIMVFIGKRYLKNKEPPKPFSIKELRRQETIVPDYRLYEKETVTCHFCGCRSEYRHGFCMRCGGALPLPKEKGRGMKETEKM